jgi:hypothetical protein
LKRNATPLHCCINIPAQHNFPSFAQQKDQRRGNCEQTKSLHEYFCIKKGNPAKDDVMTIAKITCNNAKRSIAAACDSASEKVASYTFD